MKTKNSVNDKYVSISIGCIDNVKTNRNGKVKYEVVYKDSNGNLHLVWSDWTTPSRYNAGDSIPVKSLLIPGTFGKCSVLLEVNNIIQHRIEPYIAITAMAMASSLLVGYAIGKAKHD